MLELLIGCINFAKSLSLFWVYLICIFLGFFPPWPSVSDFIFPFSLWSICALWSCLFPWCFFLPLGAHKVPCVFFPLLLSMMFSSLSPLMPLVRLPRPGSALCMKPSVHAEEFCFNAILAFGSPVTRLQQNERCCHSVFMFYSLLPALPTTCLADHTFKGSLWWEAQEIWECTL